MHRDQGTAGARAYATIARIECRRTVDRNTSDSEVRRY